MAFLHLVTQMFVFWAAGGVTDGEIVCREYLKKNINLIPQQEVLMYNVHFHAFLEI